MLVSLIYASTAAHSLDRRELLEILQISRVHNARRQITGMLAYHAGSFLQVLEGPEDAVNGLFLKILNDRRHLGVILLDCCPIETRQFEAWEMAFFDLDDPEVRSQPAFSPFLNDDLTAEKFRQSPGLAAQMLLAFRDHLR